MTKTLVLKWAWRYHRLGVEEYDTLDSAVRQAGYASDMGEESLDHIEVWEGDRVTSYPADKVWELLKPIQKAEEVAYSERIKERPVVADLEVFYGDKWTHFSGFYSMEEAQVEYDRLREFLGDRVRITPTA